MSDRPRGTRPRNRRALITAAATELIAKHGYALVSMTELADAVGIGASALYRHFTGKQALLAEVITVGMAPARDLILGLDLDDAGSATPILALHALDHRHLGLMWQREARNLASYDHGVLRGVLREISVGMAAFVSSARPDLGNGAVDVLARSVLAILASPSFHRVDLPRPAYDQLLTELVEVALHTDLPSVSPGAPRAGRADRPAVRQASRREELLDHAVLLFAAHGYSQVGVEDIGQAVGIAGPSVYNHWPNKLDLLITPVLRGASALAMDVSTAYRVADTAEDVLRWLVRSYVTRSRTHHDLFSLLITDIEHLPEPERHAARRAQHDYVVEWAHLLRLHDPAVDANSAQIRVHAALSVANDTARSQRLRRNPAVLPAVEAICANLLSLPPAT